MRGFPVSIKTTENMRGTMQLSCIIMYNFDAESLFILKCLFYDSYGNLRLSLANNINNIY